jgi:hypothetical protein
MADKITVRELEERILELEEIVIRIRAPHLSQVNDYSSKDGPYTRKAAGTTSITDWLEQRVKPCIGDLEYSIVSGEYTTPHGRTKLSTLRNSYEQ